MERQNSLTQIRDQKIKQRNTQIKHRVQMVGKIMEELKVNNQLANQITNSSATQLVEMLNQFKLSSVQITAAFAYRAGTVGIALNLVTQDNFEEAIRFAQKCDQLRRQTNKKNWCFGDAWDMDKFFPPLFGIPISIKDTIDLEGFASTVGCIARINKIQKDGTIMHCLKNSGMIPFLKTNVPQMAMTFETNNNIWGRAVNPWNKNRTPGGSSGGEGGLIAIGGSPIGLGADIGGSIRIPAQFCGISSLKPSSTRLSFDGHTAYVPSMDGAKGVMPTLGPLAKNVNDLALWLKTVSTVQLYKQNYDPYIKLCPFNDLSYLQSQSKKKRIGFIESLQFIQPSPASKRALWQSINILKQFDHELIPIQFINQNEVFTSVLIDFNAEGQLKSYTKMTEGEPLIPEYSNLQQIASLEDNVFRTIVNQLNETDPRKAVMFKNTGHRTVFEYLENAGNIKSYRKQWVQYLKQKKIDLVICPGFGSQAVLHGFSNDVFFAALYTALWNTLDVPVGTIPVTVVQNDEQYYQSKHNDDFTKILKKNAQDSKGLPVGIQIVGFPYQEQKILGIMKILEEKIKFNQNFHVPNQN